MNEEELTPKDIFADPDISRLVVGVDIPMPILLLIESINNVPESKLTLPDMVCNPPLRVVLPDNTVLPDTDSWPLKSAVFPDITNLPVLLPSNIVLDVAANAVVLPTNPEVENDDELITPT